jgi:PAS domain S-box-containing protein
MADSVRTRILAFTIIALVVSTITAIVVLGAQTTTLLETSHRNWIAFRTNAEAKIILISQLRSSLGYGGLIHNYKDLTLRRDVSRVPMIEGDLDRVITIIDEYEQMRLMSWEAKPVNTIRRTINLYQRFIVSIRQHMESSKSISENIFTANPIPDMDIIAALDELDRLWAKESTVRRKALSGALEEGVRLVWIGAFVIPVIVLLGGVVVWFIGRLMREISRRIRYQAELERAHANLEQAQSIAHLGSWEWKPQNDEMVFSDETFRIFGFEPDAMAATLEVFLNMVHPQDRDAVQQKIVDAQNEKQSYAIDHRIITADKYTKTVQNQAVTELDDSGNLVRLAGTLHDITDRQNAFDFVAHQLTLQQDILDAVPAPIFYVDTTLTVIGCNKGCEEVTGYARDDMLGMNVFEVLPSALAALCEEDGVDAVGHTAPQVSTVEFTNPDGKAQTVEALKSSFLDSEGNLGGFVVVLS